MQISILILSRGALPTYAFHHHVQLNWTPEIVDDFLKQRDTWLAFTSVVGIIFLVVVCLFIFLWQRIRIAIALIEQVKLTFHYQIKLREMILAMPKKCFLTRCKTFSSPGISRSWPIDLQPLLPPPALPLPAGRGRLVPHRLRLPLLLEPRRAQVV